MKKITGLTAMAVACVFAMLLLSGCSWDDERGKGDSSAGKQDDSAASCTNMPDGFPNTCTKCVKGHEPWAIVTSTDRIVIAIQDPKHCGGEVVPGQLLAEGN